MPNVAATVSSPSHPADPAEIPHTSNSAGRSDTPQTPEAILAAIQHPNLSKYLINTENQSIGYELALQQFQRSDEFKSFAQEMIDCLKRLQAGKYSGIEHKGYSTLINELELVEPKGGTVRHSAPTLLPLYEDACLSLRHIDTLLRYAHQNPKHVPVNAASLCIPILQNLEAELDICGPGLIQKTKEIATSLKHALFPPKLPERVETMRFVTAQQAIREVVADLFKSNRYYAVNEVHMVKTWMDELAPQLGLQAQKFDDVYASKQTYFDSVPMHIRNKAFEKIRQLVSIPNTLGAIAQEGLDLAGQELAKLTPAQQASFKDAVELVLPKLANAFGEVKPNVIFRLNDTFTPEIHTNPTLLVVHLLNTLKADRELQTRGPEWRVARFALNATGSDQLCQWGPWTWIEEGPPNKRIAELLTLDAVTEDQINHACTQLKGANVQNFLVELLRNQPEFEDTFNYALGNDLPDQLMVSAAFICAHSGMADAQKMLAALEPFVQNFTVSARSLLAASAVMRLEQPQQIIEAFEQIHELGHPNLQYTSLQNTLLSDILGDCNPKLRTHLLGMPNPNNQLVNDAYQQCIFNNRGDVLTELLDHLPGSAEAAQNVATRLIQEQAESINNKGVLDAILKYSPRLNEEVEDSYNALEFWLSEKNDEQALQMLNAWIAAGLGDYENHFGEHPIELAAAGLKINTLNKMLNSPELFPLQARKGLLDHALWLAISNKEYNSINTRDQTDICRMLLQKGANPNGEAQRRPLLEVIKGHHSETHKIRLIELLLEHGATHVTDHLGHSAVDYCGSLLLNKTLAKLLEHASVFKPSKVCLENLVMCRYTPMHLEPREANEHRIQAQLEMLKQLEPFGLNLHIEVQNNKTALELAIDHGNHDFAIRALALDKSLDALGADGLNKLHHAVINNKLGVVRVLVGAGANVNAKSSLAHARKTPLHYARRNANLDMIQLLFSLGADPKIRDAKLRRAQDYNPAPRARR
ncbi:ankyrin repeat domain-containing protein [Limnobacter sp.]